MTVRMTSPNSVAKFTITRIAIAVVATFSSGVAREAPTTQAPLTAVQPPNRNLDASLYVQTAAEYRACCYQAYNLAIARLKEKLAKQSGPKPPAVVMDLDETVLDNSGFRATLVRSGLDYDDRLWDQWQQDGFEKVASVPGAKEFIVEAGNKGVAVVFVSNRDEKFRNQTKRIFERLGIPITNDNLLKLKKLETDSDDKTSRFGEAERDYTVLLYIGDSLRDFDNNLRCIIPNNATAADLDYAIRQRKDAVDRDRQILGDKWIILPNPVYGEWIAPLGRGYADIDRLAPAAFQVNQPPLAIRGATEVNASEVIVLCVVSATAGATMLFVLIRSNSPTRKRGDR